jgi:hypothetical protein
MRHRFLDRAWTRRESRYWGVAIGVATLALITGGALSGWKASESHGRLDQIRAQRDAQLRQQEEDQRRRLSEMTARDPAVLLADVVARNEEFSRTVTHWDDHGRPASMLSSIQRAQSACMAAIVAYDVVAARYTDLLPSGLPEQIDLDQGDMNCSAEAFRLGALQM